MCALAGMHRQQFRRALAPPSMLDAYNRGVWAVSRRTGKSLGFDACVRAMQGTRASLVSQQSDLCGLLNAAGSRRSRRFLLIRAERQPVLGTPIFTGHKHDEPLVAPPNRATDGTYGLALRVELRALAGGRVYQMSGRHMVRAVNGSLAGMANVCFVQCGSANICWRVSRRIYSPLVRRTSANAGLNDSTSPRTLLGQLLASCTPSH